MSTVFFDYQGIVHHEFQQQGSTITADSYLGVLRRLRKAIRQKRPELWGSKSWILHHDNAQAQTAHNISKFLQDHLTSVFSIPLQSRFGPLRLLRLWKAQKKLQSRKYQRIEEIKVESKKAMKAIPKTDYQRLEYKVAKQGSTITADSYLGVLRRLRKAIRQKRPELWGSKSWILHHDNAQAQTAHNISKFLQDHLTSVFSIPLQSRFGPLRLLRLWKAQKKLQSRKYQRIEEIKVESKKAMKAIPKTDYQRCFADWKKKVAEVHRGQRGLL
ncbi:CLCN3 [Cordylochernes scorpioides]|uniref:CLCN3 n=1 Tax=Cordylochernes scorpioides TaxID=51811 RepID=A0ABY6LI92_9ARAC|nr:CLCN3 [Cordylochernes scorpioides]